MNKMTAILYALLAAVFYAMNVPVSKALLQDVGPTTMAAFLYLGAGIGIGILSLFHEEERKPLSKEDLPYVIGMILLDIAAPIFLMIGIRNSSSASVSLLGNFEIVATTIIALFVFREEVTKRLWAAIGLITLSSILLSFEGTDSFRFSYGSLYVLAATVCWGLENNCTRKISSKSTYEIVILKGVFSGLGITSDRILPERTVSSYRQYNGSFTAGIYCLRTQYLPVCKGTECHRCCQDEFLLCGQSIHWSLPVFPVPPRGAFLPVLHRSGDHGSRDSNRDRGYSDPSPCASAQTYFYAYT